MPPMTLHDPDTCQSNAVQPHEWQRARASLERARITRQPLRLCEALVELGRCARRSAQAERAADWLDEALRWARVVGSTDLIADLCCERGELAADLALAPPAPGRTPDADAWLLARACAAEAATLSVRTSDPSWEISLLLRASDLLDRLGSPAEATALQVRALARAGIDRLDGGRPSPAIEMQGHPTLQ